MSYNAELYMHELDRKAFAALNQFPKFVKLQEAYIANVDEKAAKIEFLSTAIRLSDNQMPEIYNLLPPICEKLGIVTPDLYMIKSENKDDLNAFTGGITEPFICVTSELVKQCPPEMVSSVIAHECGHIACKHVVYHSLARNFANGIAASPLTKIPGIKRYISRTLITALRFWDRCSELSADRAAVLCDGSSDKTVEMLLKIRGFDENINREEFIKQALDLKEFVNDSKSNKMMEQMLVQWNSHPLLATRAYEVYDWENSNQYKGIIDGTFTVEDLQEENEREEEQEIINASITIEDKSSEASVANEVPVEYQIALEQRLNQVNNELDRYTNYADGVQYAYSIACGIISGAIDSAFFADTTIINNDIGFSHRQVNEFIQEYAASRGLGGDRLKDCISDLEQAFKVAQDNVWKGADIGVSAKNHHLADLAHHPTPAGLMSALIVQFLRVGTFVNKDGEWHFKFVPTTKEDIANIAIPAVITGVLNWLIAISTEKYEEESGKEIPQALKRLAHVIASTPEIIEVVKCADNWFGHLVSDMGGSKNTAGGGMGVPGVFLSLLHEVSSLPILKDSNLPAIVNDLYVNKKLDLRHELALAENLKLQSVPVIFNEICVRLGFMLLQLETELLENGSLERVNWRRVVPFANRSVDRCLAIAAITFNVVDTGDAALRAAIESGGNWVLFSGRFVARYNFVGAGRAALAIVKEVSNEKKEAQLIHERMLLMDTKAQIMYQQLQQFKAQLEEKVSNYLAEDISAFMEGFDYMKEGLETGDSNLVIKGNVVIQKVLGREPQFTTQEEFDELMESDAPLQF
ncbi:MAG: M48 family metallopeptidase [Solobacterium sp.]|nr:M48 family metallopeptidase [Solobacterium sp.]